MTTFRSEQTQAEVFGVDELTQAEIFELAEESTSRTYGVWRMLSDTQRAERAERRKTRLAVVAMLKGASDEDWYRWIVDVWAPCWPQETRCRYQPAEKPAPLPCIDCDRLPGYMEGGFCGACWLRLWSDAGGVEGGECW